ncbi:MAG: glycosyltransferase family 2 protein [Paludibacteraceae bacterium]|nr:glycosyltransferase family 2 protein [Paludibacteraceae bacterium]
MISVCIATYNGEAYIREQLESILSQLSSTDEVVVADDGSTDRTLEIIQSFADTRIRLLRMPSHLSVSKTFYTALTSAHGDILFLSDQDDVWLSGKVERCIEALKTSDLVVIDARVTDAQLHEIAPSLFRIAGSKAGLWKNVWKCTFYGSGMAFKRQIWEMAQPTPAHDLIAHDWWIGEVAEMVGKVQFIPEPWYIYRRHDNNVTPLEKSKRPLSIKIKARLEMLLAIISFQLKRL